MRGLFVNTEKAICSIHESGLMVHECLRYSTEFTIDYMEIQKGNLEIPATFDFYLFNYHFSTTSWLDTRSIRKLPGLKGTIVLEVLPNDPFVACSPFDFDFYCVLDPSMTLKHPKVFIFPRPLDNYTGELDRTEHYDPVIGTFGFATSGKGFDHVVRAVNREFDNAHIKINIPFGTYTDTSRDFAKQLGELCTSLAKPGIKVSVTHEYMTKGELIYWCSKNSINCFLYDRKMAGLAATTDQAVVSERPIAISNNPTFRHLLKYILPYPELSLKDAIKTTKPIIRKIKDDWSMESFQRTFELMLKRLKPQPNPNTVGYIHLSITKKAGVGARLQKYLTRLMRYYYKLRSNATSH
jgi:hypothetical protein